MVHRTLSDVQLKTLISVVFRGWLITVRVLTCLTLQDFLKVQRPPISPPLDSIAKHRLLPLIRLVLLLVLGCFQFVLLLLLDLPRMNISQVIHQQIIRRSSHSQQVIRPRDLTQRNDHLSLPVRDLQERMTLTLELTTLFHKELLEAQIGILLLRSHILPILSFLSLDKGLVYMPDRKKDFWVVQVERNGVEGGDVDGQVLFSDEEEAGEADFGDAFVQGTGGLEDLDHILIGDDDLGVVLGMLVHDQLVGPWDIAHDDAIGHRRV